MPSAPIDFIVDGSHYDALHGGRSGPDPNSKETIQVQYEGSFNERTGIETGTFRVVPPGHVLEVVQRPREAAYSGGSRCDGERRSWGGWLQPREMT